MWCLNFIQDICCREHGVIAVSGWDIDGLHDFSTLHLLHLLVLFEGEFQWFSSLSLLKGIAVFLKEIVVYYELHPTATCGRESKPQAMLLLCKDGAIWIAQ